MRCLQGKLDEAEELMKQALAIDKKVYGEDHPEIATDLNSLALLLKAQASPNFLGTLLEPPCC